jgi:multidrug efflux pump subunit AcrA (membrane-fusion protein)
MSVTSISSSTDPYQNSTFQQARVDFQSLADALKSGSVDQAQQALGQLQSDLPAGAANSPFAQVLDKISTALQSGDVSSAQQALSGLQQAHRGHRGHHHHHGSDSSQSTTSSTTDPTSLLDPTSTVGTTINVTA